MVCWVDGRQRRLRRCLRRAELPPVRPRPPPNSPADDAILRLHVHSRPLFLQASRSSFVVYAREVIVSDSVCWDGRLARGRGRTDGLASSRGDAQPVPASPTRTEKRVELVRRYVSSLDTHLVSFVKGWAGVQGERARRRGDRTSELELTVPRPVPPCSRPSAFPALASSTLRSSTSSALGQSQARSSPTKQVSRR